MATSIIPPYPLFADATGTALENGFIYIGTAHLPAKTNQIPVYWDEALTVPASQPLRTIGGRIVRNGTPANVYAASLYSIEVRNRNEALVYSNDNVNLLNDSLPLAGGTLTGALRIEAGNVDNQVTVASTDSGAFTSYNDNTTTDEDAVLFGAVGDSATIRGDDGVKGRAKKAGTDVHLAKTPTAWGASESGTAAANDTVFAEMATKLGSTLVDLEGKSWPVTEVPDLNAENGFWVVSGFDEALDACCPAKGTLDRTVTYIEGGKRTIAWAQDTFHSYNGMMIGGYMPADGHNPGSMDWTVIWSSDGGKSICRFETGTDFQATDAAKALVENEVHAACVVPPSTDGGASDGAYQYAISKQSDGFLNFYNRPLAEYQQSGTGGLDQAEGDWDQILFDGVSFGAGLRTKIDAAYSVTTSGLPTVTHGLTLIGSNAGSNGNVITAFHGLTGASTGPYMVITSGSPKTGTGTIDSVGRIGLLTQGIEPTHAWYKNGSGERICGLIRSAGIGYPIRFYSIDTFSQAGIEAATIQDCPFGNDFGTGSPAPVRMRPRRKGARSGWIVTSETIDGDSTDELHFVFTGTRDRDGEPGVVWLYWGYVTRGDNDFDDMWARAKVIPIMPLYFANSNATSTSNQVGIGSMTFVDANTLVIAASSERPAVRGDYDEGGLFMITIKLHDDYADATERRIWDDGSNVPQFTQRAPEFFGYDGQFLHIGPETEFTIASGDIRITTGNVAVDTEGEAASDDLDNIFIRNRNPVDGEIIYVSAVNSDRTVVVKDGTGNIELEADISLDNARDVLPLKYNAETSTWRQISFANNAA